MFEQCIAKQNQMIGTQKRLLILQLSDFLSLIILKYCIFINWVKKLYHGIIVFCKQRIKTKLGYQIK